MSCTNGRGLVVVRAGGRCFWKRRVAGAVVLLLTGVLIGSSSVRGAVPPALRQRTQEPAVEAVIKALEDKATAAGNGTWTTQGGWQDVPSTQWVTGIQNNNWYWRAPNGSRYRSDTVYSDGELFYDVPRRQWFGLDVAEQGQRLEFRQGYYLLHVNLRPRQFLGAAGGLTVIGEEQIEGAAYLHLQASPQRDATAAADPYLQPRQARVTIDLYYDATRKAIARSTMTDVNAHYTCAVTAWDNFATAGAWPKRIESRQFINLKPDVAPPPQQPPVHLITVDTFAPGEDPQVVAVGQTVAAVPFFASDARRLRQPSTYAALATNEPAKLTWKVALAESTLRSGDPAEGLRQWDAIGQALAADEQGRLTNVLAPSAAHSLHKGYRTQPEACVTMLTRLAALPPEPNGPEVTASPMFTAWKSLRKRPALAERIAAIEPALLQRFVHSPNSNVIEGLIKTAAAKADDAAVIDPVLNQVAAAQLPKEGYAQSQLALLVASSIEARQWDRAAHYLSAVNWNAQTLAEAKAPVALLQQLLGERPRAETGSAQSLPVLIEVYRQAWTPAFPSAKYARGTAEKLAMRLGASAARASDAPAELVAGTAGNANASAFWGGVIKELLETRVRGAAATNTLVATAEVVGKAVEQRLGVAGFAAQTLMQIGASRSLEGVSTFSSSTRLTYLNRAFAAASTDDVKLKVLQAIAVTYTADGAFDEAQQAVTSLKGSLTSAESKTAADAILANLTQDKTAAQAQADALERQLASDRLSGQLKHLEGQLAVATKRERPAAELKAIQDVIDQTKQELASAASTTTTTEPQD